MYRLRLVPYNSLQEFNVIERDLFDDSILKLGRFLDKSMHYDRIMFKSKVVSRGHAEIWVQDNQFYIRDTQSSSGTFLNKKRLSNPNQASKPYPLKNGDVIQLGINYDEYHCVKLIVEIPASLNSSIGCCCICLSPMGPPQALFISSCSHTFHFKCLLPLFKNFSMLTCPLCRSPTHVFK